VNIIVEVPEITRIFKVLSKYTNKEHLHSAFENQIHIHISPSIVSLEDELELVSLGAYPVSEDMFVIYIEG
jgi:hypothetical protein